MYLGDEILMSDRMYLGDGIVLGDTVFSSSSPLITGDDANFM